MRKAIFIMLFTLAFALLAGQESNWKVYRAPGSSTSIAYGNNELWIVSGAGVMRWNPASDAKTQYNIDNAPPLIASAYRVHVSQAGDVWVGCRNGVLRFDGAGWLQYDSDNSIFAPQLINSVAEDQNGAIWALNSSNVYKFYNGVWSVYNHSNTPIPMDAYLGNLVVDHQNRLWMTDSGGVWCYDGIAWTKYTHANSSLPDDVIKSIRFENNGVGWFGGYDGVARYSDGQWQLFSTLGGYSMAYTSNIYVDAWNRVWFCTDTGLLCKDGENYSFYPESTFASYSILISGLLVDPDQNIWIRLLDTDSPLSLAKFDTINVTRYPISNFPLPSHYVQSIFKGYDGNLWIGTAHGDGNGGYLSIDGDEVETFGQYNTDMPCDHVWALEQDSSLNMWVSTCIGLLRTGPSGSQIFDSVDTGISVSYLYTICAVDDGVWIGGEQGVSRYQNGTWSVLTTAEAGMNLGNTRSIEKDLNGDVWIACAAGVCYYRNGQFTAYPQLANARDLAFQPDGTVWIARGELSCIQNGIITHYNTSNSGLTENHVCSVAVDHSQRVWAGSYYPDCVLYCFADGVWTSFNPDNSPLSGTIIQKLYVDDDNTLWIGGLDLTLYNASGIPSATDEQLAPELLSATIYPNPFRGQTSICYSKQVTGPVSVSIYNIKGQLIRALVDENQAIGRHQLLFDGLDSHGKRIGIGIYFCRVKAGNHTSIHKMVLME